MEIEWPVVGNDGTELKKELSWRRRALIAAGVFCALLLLFHRPIILGLGRRIALHFAAKENLQLDFRLEGNPFTNLTVRNLHAISTGASDIESMDVDFAHVDYGLITLIRKGLSSALQNVDVRSARIVLNPAKTLLRPRPPDPNKKISLPDVFPERVHLSDVTFAVRNQPHDFAMEGVDLDLDPHGVGQLTIGKLQLVGGQQWLRISAQTSYANRDLLLHDVILANDERIRSLAVDASQISARKLAITFDYAAGGGTISGSLALREAQHSLDTDVHIRAEKVPLGVINKYAALPENFITGEIETLSADIKGLLSSPRTWNATGNAHVTKFRQEMTAFDNGVFKISAENGTATLQAADIIQGQNQFHLHGSSELPASLEQFGRTPAKFEVAGSVPDLAQATASLPRKVSGAAQINGHVQISNAKLDGDFAIAGTNLGFDEGAIETVSAVVKVAKVIPPLDSNQPWYTDLKSETTFSASNLKFRDYAADSLEGTLHGVNDSITFERGVVRRKQNEFVVGGEYRLPRDFHDALIQPAKINLSLNVVQLADYWIGESADKISGPLQVYGQVEWKNGAANGQLSAYGTDLRMRDLALHQISMQCSIVDSVVYLNDVTARINQQDFVTANAIFDLHAPFRYTGKLKLNLADLSNFQPLLRASGNDTHFGGSFAVDWEGSGEAKTFKNSGKLKLALDKGSYGALQALQARIDATYSPDGFDVPIIFFQSDKMDFQAVAHARGETLEVSKIQLDQGTAKYAEGYVSVPFVWKNIGTGAPLFAANGKVTANFQSENLDLKKMFEDIGMQPPGSGTLNLKLDAGGTLENLDAKLELHGRDLRSAQVPELEPASFDLTALAKDGQLGITGTLQQAKIQPLELKANVPLQMTRILRERKLPDDTPVNATLRLPRSSVNFVRQFVPAIEELDGDAALDVVVKGTMAQPVLNGSGDMTVNVGRFTNATLPALQNFKARVVFTRDTLQFERFGGELAGGPFTLSGHIAFPKLTDPNFDLQLKANSVLVARNDSMTARADADVRVVGPLKAASVTGNVALTNSHFLKNLDLLPIGLPGRPAPEPPASRPQFSFPQPPLRDWKFDVAIKTKDPFLIRGSLANGGAVIDLHLNGTGLHPGLEGQVRLDNVEATLPFSRLDVQYGFLYFDPSDPLNPKIDLHGTSVIRDYTIHVYVYGRSLSPEAVFTSEPPLPQEEIISLLATGTTRQELTGNNNVLAGRAAMLLFQQLYRKVFKKGESTKSNTVFDRLEVDAGQVDPRTGQQTATARFKINQQFVLIGDIEVGGDFRGMIKYLIRFH